MPSQTLRLLAYNCTYLVASTCCTLKVAANAIDWFSEAGTTLTRQPWRT